MVMADEGSERARAVLEKMIVFEELSSQRSWWHVQGFSTITIPQLSIRDSFSPLSSSVVLYGLLGHLFPSNKPFPLHGLKAGRKNHRWEREIVRNPKGNWWNPKCNLSPWVGIPPPLVGNALGLQLQANPLSYIFITLA